MFAIFVEHINGPNLFILVNIIEVKRHLFIVSMLFFTCLCSAAQMFPDTSKHETVQVNVIKGDTLLVVNMGSIVIYANPAPPFKNPDDERKYWRLVRNLKVVYPYAKMAKVKLDSLNQNMASLKSDKERREYAKAVEKRLEKQLTPVLNELTYPQGDLLVKLIDRETGQSPYQLVKELRGGFRAVFYQAIARVFTHNLKDKYDKDGDDKTIEAVLRAIEAGYY